MVEYEYGVGRNVVMRRSSLRRERDTGSQSPAPGTGPFSVMRPMSAFGHGKSSVYGKSSVLRHAAPI